MCLSAWPGLFDYDEWRSEFGTTNFMSDGNDDGLVDAADYVVWRKHLPPPASGAALDAAVPEPGALLLAVLGSLMFAAGRRREPVLPVPSSINLRSPPH